MRNHLFSTLPASLSPNCPKHPQNKQKTQYMAFKLNNKRYLVFKAFGCRMYFSTKNRLFLNRSFTCVDVLSLLSLDARAFRCQTTFLRKRILSQEFFSPTMR